MTNQGSNDYAITIAKERPQLNSDRHCASCSHLETVISICLSVLFHYVDYMLFSCFVILCYWLVDLGLCHRIPVGIVWILVILYTYHPAFTDQCLLSFCICLMMPKGQNVA